MIARRHLGRGPRRRPFALALLLGAMIALAVPGSAAAQGLQFIVNSNGEGETKAGCEAGAPAECTLRGAIMAANAAAGFDAIAFVEGTKVEPTAELPELSAPANISGGFCPAGGGKFQPCSGIKAPTTFPALRVGGGEVVVQSLAIEGGSVGVRVNGTAHSKVTESVITGAEVGIELSGASGGTANQIEGNSILVPFSNNSVGIRILDGPNQVFGNRVEGSCCLSGIFLLGPANGNRIGGDTEASENVITGFSNGAISMTLAESTRNEVGRNRGIDGAKFIGLFKANSLEPNFPNSISPPTITRAVPTSITGTAKAGAKVRVFQTPGESLGEIEGFLGEAVADGSGNWKVELAGVPVSTMVTATQTLAGGTSELSGTTAVVTEPPPNNGGGGGGETDGGTTQPAVTPIAAAPVTPITIPAPTKPSVRIAKGPARSSKATTAKFRFTATPAAGATFECKLDGRKWAKCKSPATYKMLKPGRHTFQVRATASGLTGAPTKFRFTVKS